jgi:hypothetical protein
MAEYCTCGAQLPPDALFCHKCGKPQRELVAPEIEANTYGAAPVVATAAPPPIPQPQPLPLNFHNPIAVRIALVAAVSATMLGLLLPRMPFVSWLAGGFFAVYLYCRKTGFRVDVASGVKIGWITGLILYGLFAIVITTALLPAAISGNLGKILMEQMQTGSILVRGPGDCRIDRGGNALGFRRQHTAGIRRLRHRTSGERAGQNRR